MLWPFINLSSYGMELMFPSLYIVEDDNEHPQQDTSVEVDKGYPQQDTSVATDEVDYQEIIEGIVIFFVPTSNMVLSCAC